MCIEEDGRGQIWFGGSKGIDIFSADSFFSLTES